MGVPTVLDRVIQQALAQILSPIFDADFSEESYGFRAGRRASDAVQRISEHSQSGYKWGVECDLKSFFDVVNHDLLMHRIGLKVRDKSVLCLIGKYLRAGVRLEDGTTERTPRGVPQGGPLSPLLANIMLDPLDTMIEEMGLPFVRYADDFIVLAKSKSEAQAALDELRRFVEGKLKLLINDDKTRVAPLGKCEFLGFVVRGKHIRISEKSRQRFLYRIRQETSRRLEISMEVRLSSLKKYCVGWFNYFKIGFLYKDARAWDGWMRRRIRMCYWKMWYRGLARQRSEQQLPRKRRRMLIKLGVDPSTVKMATRSRKGYWRLSSHPFVRYALSNAWLEEQGMPSLCKLWIGFYYKGQERS
ncbi:reverse transcriptase domain-containing protein [Puniceicoccaceae bacterium K14]|nr:reverse transcriptase domain-containing protein [Puniceicoccaceae bacterium K14]